MREYLKNLFAQLRVFVITDGTDLTDENLVKAVTLNENLKAYGFTLKPADLVRVAKSATLDRFFEIFKSLQSDVKASPMYPDFPKQVMNMSEAEFRMHQLMHYFSTYGMEMIFGTRLDKAWYPDVESTEKTEKDVARRLLDFLSGVAYAQEGKIKKVALQTYIVTPYNVDIMGDLIDELENNGLYL